MVTHDAMDRGGAAVSARALGLEDALWERFVDAGGGGEFVTSWLALQCARLKGALAGLVLFEETDGASFSPVAVWPDASTDFTRLRPIAEEAVNEKRGIVRRDPGEDGAEMPVRIGYPISLDGHVSGLVVIELAPASDRNVQVALRDLHWGVGWLEIQILRRRTADDRSRLDRTRIALDMLAVAGEAATPEGAAMAAANELALKLGCERVAVGLVVGRPGRGSRLRLAALSNTAYFKRRGTLVAALENAMEEALDQAATVAAPEIEGVPRAIAVAHRAYAGDHNAAVASTVLTHAGVPVGVLTFERRDGARFDRGAVLTVEAVADLLGPMLDLKRRQRRWLSGRLPEAVAHGFTALFGCRRPTAKLAAAAALGALAFVALFPATYRVSAKASLEGAEQRAVVAPFEGFVAETHARAGDVVHRGDTLVVLEDKDLKLDQAKWRSEYARLAQEKRKALATFDRSESALVDAQLEEAKAQLDLTEAKLDRATLTAPIDGVVLSGDWSQKLGAPVEQGTVIFELSPLESYRIALDVDEGDVALVHVGQSGTLLLAGRADASLPFAITRVTSVAKVEDGNNVFRVEASLPGEAAMIRPGMEGVGKIDIDRRAIGLVWSKRLIDWARLFFWRNTP